MMAAPDLELLKDIPGYQAILRAILKTQIQQLVEQLAEQAGEESILLTASITDGTLCHLGSTSGRDFLQGHEDLKSKFLGFCLKRHHMREEMDVETSSSPAPPHVVVNVPTKQSSHKPTPSPLRKPYQRRVGPKFAKSRIHVQPPRTEVHPVGVFRTSINGNEEDDPVIENEPGGAVTMTNSGDSDHQTVQFDNSSSDVPQPLPHIDFVESVLPIKVEDNSSLAPAASYTETETVVESADKTYREVVKIKQEPQADIDDEVADMVYRIGAEGSQMGAADWDTSMSGLGPASDNAESGLEMDNNQTPYTGTPVLAASSEGESFVVCETHGPCPLLRICETPRETPCDTPSESIANTVKTTRSHMKAFQAYLTQLNEGRNIEKITPDELDMHFGNFILAARKTKYKDSDAYGLYTIQGYMCSLDRYLGERGWPRGVIRSAMFPYTNACFKEKMKNLQLRQIANDKPCDEHHQFTDDDIDRLFQRGIAGIQTPAALVNFLHLTVSSELGIRPGKQQRQLRWGDIEVKAADDGREYLNVIQRRTTVSDPRSV